MRRLLPAWFALALLMIVTGSAICHGQDEAPIPKNLHFSPDVETVWHKLGIPQSVGRFKKFRESRVNRKGNHPEREKKPRLKKLTDPANLAPEAPKMLQAAAQIKKAEDLAPQKIKALKYLATIGCGCYNKKNAGLVEAALLEGMEDCTCSVRREALMVVMKQVSGGCSCSCQPACNSKSCCTPKLYKKLEEIATKMDKTGCPIEPDAGIRNLAMQVLNACPYPMIEPEDEETETEEKPKPKPQLDKPTESGDSATESGEGDDDSGSGEDSDGEPSIDDEIDMLEEARRRRRTPAVQTSYKRRASRLAAEKHLNSFDASERMLMEKLEVTGAIESVRLEQGNTTIAFDEGYEFEAGLRVVLAATPDSATFGVVKIARAGSAVIEVEDFRALDQWQPSMRIRLGVLED